ncbi:nucleotide disphospho-sugar-binding domain-containing protein [Steroidobacter flavus]|uniref:Nucleotide disphospho-sugar-binding domain-containing protein n=1 Tax=Steroidobacter flavus TaxID=1842136 RepID=A0ABV8T3K0_9GAMM
MARRHVAVFTLMGKGHLLPVLPLCSELVTRGYRVTCPAISKFIEPVRATGAEPVPYRSTPASDALTAENELRAQSPLNDPARFETSDLEWEHLVRETDAFLAQVGPFYAEHRPDLIVYNRYSIPARIIARRCQRRAVQFSPHFAYPGRTRYWDRGRCVTPAAMIPYAQRLDELFHAHDLRQEGNLWHTEPLNIHFIPRAFQYRADLFDETFLFIGNRSRSHAGADKVEPLILVSGYSGLAETQTSNRPYFRMFLEAIAGMHCRGILSIGDDVPVDALGPLPANVTINRDRPNTEIISQATLFACHGGMSSTLEALCHGVPVLAVPGSPYTLEVAHRVAELGLGRVVPQSELSVATIRQSLDLMIRDQALSERTREMQGVFAESGNAVTAIDAVETFMSSL